MLDPGPAIEAALSGVGMTGVEFRRVTNFDPSATPRSAFRVRLAGGGLVKVRRLRNAARAETMASLVGRLDDDAFARILHRDGNVVVEEWIDGEDLGERSPTGDELRAAAEILARLHAPPALERAPSAERVIESWAARIEEGIAGLLESVAISPAVAAELRAGVARLRPTTTAVGFVHTDFCGENLVVTPAGALRVIDNEGLSVGSVDFDLARTWYRWRLPAPAWRAFVGEYRRLGGTADAAESPFWRLAAVVKSAWLRVSRGERTSDVPLHALHALAAGLREQGE